MDTSQVRPGNTGPRPDPGRTIEEHTMTTSPISPDENRRLARNPGDEMLTLQEACHYLRIPEGTLRYWRHLGTGPHSFRLGRRVLYRADDLQAWISTHRDHDGPRKV
jgi:excisionase family DNA binding protein